MPLEPVGDRDELLVHLRHAALQVVDVLGRADAGDHVLALRGGEELGVEPALAGARVAREADARARRLAEVAENHRHDRDGRAPAVRDPVDAPVLDGLLREPGVEHGVDREVELLGGLLRERRARALGDDVLVDPREPLELLGGHLGVAPDAEPALRRPQVLLEGLAPDAEDHAGEHRDEAAVAVPREAVVLRPRREAEHRAVVEAEVEDRLHHARHRDPRAGAHGQEERAPGVAELHARVGLQAPHGLADLLREPLGPPSTRLAVAGPRLRRDREARRHGNPEVGHLGEVAALAAEEVAHQGRALGLAGPEEVHVLHHGRRSTS